MLNKSISNHINIFFSVDKRQRILKGQSKMNNPDKLATQGTQDEEKHNKVPGSSFSYRDFHNQVQLNSYTELSFLSFPYI